MNEGLQITKEQAEACTRADSRFWIQPDEFVWQRIENGVWQYLANERDNAWEMTSGSNAAFNKCVQITIAADPNNTFERLFGSGELTFEEAWAALGRGETILVWNSKVEHLVKLESNPERFTNYVLREYAESGCDETRWTRHFCFHAHSRYCIYKEPTPQPEPLTLESLEARVKALEERS